MKSSAIYLIIFSLFVCAQGLAFSPNSRAILEFKDQHASFRMQDEENGIEYFPLIIKIDDESAIDALNGLGAIVYHRRGQLLLTSVPKENIDEVEDIDGIFCIQASMQANSCLDIARTSGSVSAIHAGLGLPQAYDGTGVIAGFSDVGFDPHHPAFANRIAMLTDYKAYMGEHLIATTDREIHDWTTDNYDNWHATHVANILTGGYKGNEYYGIAPDAVIAGGTSDLTDVGILSTIEDIISLSKETGKPAVINLSLSSQLGPRDGTDLVCQYLSLCAQDAIICLSAGNSGRSNISARHAFTSEMPLTRCSINTFLGYNGFNVEGITNFWSIDQRPFKLRIEVYDEDEKSIVYESEWTEIGDETSLTVSSATDPEWAAFMDGSVKAYAGWDSLNGRYCITVAYETKTTEVSVNGNWSRYRTSLAITGDEGVTVNVNSDGSYSYLGHVSGSLPTLYPSSEQSISNLCCAQGIISVGAYNSRNSAPAISGDGFHWSFEIDAPAGFSSRGETWQGQQLPHISAPGNYVVSAISNCYTSTHNISPDQVSAGVIQNGKKYYWRPECGTSMSAPFASGVIALWLQANPELTAQQALEIAQSTADKNHTDPENPQWGAGSINALEGLKKVIAQSGICAPAADPFAIVNDNGMIELIGISRDEVYIYNINSMQVSISDRLTPGAYIIKFPSYTQKLFIK